jgi:hypothetical protein
MGGQIRTARMKGQLKSSSEKGLINKRVMYRVMNTSFSRFVKSTEHMDEIQVMEKEAGESAWQASKLILVAGAVGLFVWLLWSQAELFRVGLGYVAAIGALLTTAVNFFAGGKRITPSIPSQTS